MTEQILPNERTTNGQPPGDPETLGSGRISRELAELGYSLPEPNDHGPLIRAGLHIAELPKGEREAARKAIRTAELANTPDDQLGDRAEPLDFDFEAPLPMPDYVVDRLFEREHVNIVSGDTGAAKSIAAQSLAVAAVTGGTWLGREVNAERVIYVDEENPESVVFGRLRALGMTNAERERLRYFNREGVRIGEAEWNEWLAREATGHRADLIVIDTAMAATTAEVNENDAVVALYGVLRPLASELGLAIILLHHERKHQPGMTRDRSQAMMGARQWAGQADRQVAMQVRGDVLAEEQPNGGRKLRREFVFTSAAKDRTADGGRPELIAVTSEKDSDSRLLWMRVESEGPVKPEETGQERLLYRIIAAAQAAGEAGITTAELAEASGASNAEDGTFKRALTGALEHGLERMARGRYRASESEGLAVS